MTTSGWACPNRRCHRRALIESLSLVVRKMSGGRYGCHSLSDDASRVILVKILPVESRIYPVALVKIALYPASHNFPTEMRVPVSSLEYNTLLRVSCPMLTTPILSAHIVDPFAATPVGLGLIGLDEENRDISGDMWLVAPVSYTSSVEMGVVVVKAWS